MPTYLETHPPKVRQFRTPRRAKPSGLIVVHTAESVLDQIGEDTGAEDVAAFIARRTDFGSYHTLVDSDSRVRLVPFDAEAYGDGTGSNPFAIHISFACKASGWSGMSDAKRKAMIRNGAAAAYEAAAWLKETHGIEVPPARVTRAESEAREPGFISHGERDPGRRTDPGADFPWPVFMREFVEASEADRRRARLSARIAEKRAAVKKLRAQIARLLENRKAL
jgi:hypothetical protein